MKKKTNKQTKDEWGKIRQTKKLLLVTEMN